MMIASAVLPLLSTKDDSQTADRTTQSVDPLFTRWAADYAKRETYTRTPIHLAFSRALSKRFTKAVGRVEINFETGQVTVAVENLDAPPDGSVYEVWLLENVPGVHNSAAIDLGKDGDRIMILGALPADGSLVTSVDAQELANFEVDMAAVMRLSANQKPEFVIGGMQSIRFQINRQARLAAKDHSSTPTGGGLFDYWFGPVFADKPDPEHSHGGDGDNDLDSLIAFGKILFEEETFGNGRTCATCHPVNNNLTIDIDFISELSDDDPLFIAEFDDDLPQFDPDNPTTPAFEDPVLMSARGLILENIEGFDEDEDGNLINPPFFRAVPSLFNLEFTAPYGYSACCDDLRIFSMGAVVQHFPKTLERIENTDFVLPNEVQLDALEAFMLSKLSPEDGNFKIKGKNSLLSTAEDTTASDTSRPEVRGRELFRSVGCSTCHKGKGNSVLNGNLLDTGVESLEDEPSDPPSTPTVDNGNGSGEFLTPQLFGLRKQHFFHTGRIGNNTVQIEGKSLRFTNLLDAVDFYRSDAFNDSPTNGSVVDFTDAEAEDIAAFLEAISHE
jgi:cytochrome c peroxidase